MRDKVTSYELSKRLHELGFECESHTGWWVSHRYSQQGWVEKIFCPTSDDIKAYDCWDLLSWFSLGALRDASDALYISSTGFYLEMLEYTPIEGVSQPQEALGKAIVAILEEQR